MLMRMKRLFWAPFHQGKIIGFNDLVIGVVIFLACYHYSAPKKPEAFNGQEVFVRVRLSVGQQGVRVKSAQGLVVVTDGVQRQVSDKGFVVLDQDNGRVAVRIGDAQNTPELWRRSKDTIVISSSGLIDVQGRRYRGEIRAFIIPDTGMVVVNRLNLEQYLYGVVPAEIGPIKPETFEAVKAQAVAARSFTLTRLTRRQGLGYELYDSYLRDQEYQGADREVVLGNKAVDETRGEVLIYNDEVAMALYHGNCGGVTADGSEPYLKSVFDTPVNRSGAEPFCALSSNFSWRCTVSQDSIERLLMKLKGWKIKPRVRGFSLEKDRGAKRVKKVRFQTDRGEIIVDGSEFRFALGLKSTFFQMKLHARRFNFEGRGWGHGVGLCQDGAIEMARKGYHYRQILNHYYPALRIKKLY